MLHTQTILRQYVPGLTFNLGYCGYFFDKGLESEKNGSLSLVRNRDQFWWFGHIYNHYQPHAMSEQSLREEMLLNLAFARKYNIQSTKNSYSVSPHHSGVYPVYMPLYKAWVELLNVTMTTTEEYPHLYPSHKRLGYIYQGVMVYLTPVSRLCCIVLFCRSSLGKPADSSLVTTCLRSLARIVHREWLRAT